MPELPKKKVAAGKRGAGQHSEVYRHAGAFLAQRYARRGGSRYRLFEDRVDADPALGELGNYQNGLPISVPDYVVPKSIRCAATGSRNATGKPVKVFPDGRVEAIPGGAAVDLPGVPRRQRRGMQGM